MSSPQCGRTTLLDLPIELLRSCLPSLNADNPADTTSIRSYIAVCKSILAVHLKGNSSGRLGLQLHINGPRDLPDKRARLQLLLQAFPDLQKLTLECRQGPWQEYLVHLLASPQGCKLSAPGWLERITHVKLGLVQGESQGAGGLQGAVLLLPHPVPSHVAMACPHLKELTLCGITINTQLQQQTDAGRRTCCVRPRFDPLVLEAAPQQQQQQQQQGEGAHGVLQCQQQLQQQAPISEHMHGEQASGSASESPAALLQLQRLKLHKCYLDNSPDALLEQLEMLPSLQDLSITECGLQMGEQYAGAVADSCSSRLTSLEWNENLMYASLSMVALLSVPYPQLQQLHASSVTVYDGGMEPLLQQAPSLMRLQVAGFHLQQDYSHRVCRWETVILEHGVNFASLPRTPLDHITKLHVGPCIQVYLRPTEGDAAVVAVQQIAAAAAAVARCGGLAPPEAGGLAHIYLEDMPIDVHQVLVDAFKLLGNITGCFELWSQRVTKTLLQAITSHLPHCHRVHWSVAVSFEQGVWADMVSLLPKVTETEVCIQEAELDHLKLLCAAATHPITLICDWGDFVGNDEDVNNWEAELTVAIRHAGHGYVTLA